MLGMLFRLPLLPQLNRLLRLLFRLRHVMRGSLLIHMQIHRSKLLHPRIHAKLDSIALPLADFSIFTASGNHESA